MFKRNTIGNEDRLGVTTRVVAWFGYGFLVLPSLIVIPISFGDRNEITFPPDEWSFFLYKEFFSDPTWIAATTQSFVVALSTMVFALVLGVPAAYGLVRGRFRGRSAITVGFVSPMFIPHIVTALALYFYFSALHIQGSTFGIVLAHTTITVPFVIITVMSGLRNIDPDLERAAMIMGAGRVYILRRVVVPLLRPSIIGGGLFAFLISFDEIVISWFVSSAGSITLPVKMYSSIHWSLSPILAAIATMLTILSVIGCLSFAYFQRGDEGEA